MSTLLNSKRRVWALLLALACWLPLSPLNAADGFWLLAKNLGLAGQKNWTYYDGGDAPEGAYMGWIIPGNTNLTGSIPLDRTLPPGSYYVFLKVIDYTGGGAINVSLGQASVTLRPNDRDWNRYWTGPAVVPLERASSNLTVDLLKTLTDTLEKKYLLRGVYITTNASENFPNYGLDYVLDYTYPTSMNESSDQKGNVIPDGSFETGINHGWGLMVEGNEKNYPVGALQDTNSSYDGRASVRFLSKSSQLISRTYNLSPNKKYTLSLFARVGSVGYAELGLGIYNAATPPPGFPAACSLYKSFVLSSNWVRYSITGYLTNYPHSHYQVQFQGGSNVFVDAVQLEEGNLSEYKSCSDIEIGFTSDKPGRILFQDENPALNLVAFNSSNQTLSGTLHYKVYDIYNRKVASGQQALSVAATNHMIEAFVVPPNRGIFRIVAWVKDRPRTMDETTYAVIPRPRVLGVEESSIMGVHPNLVTYQLELHQRMGIKWARAMSPEAIFRWGLIEKVEGQIDWHDDKVDRAAASGMSLLGTIGTDTYWPPWAATNGLPNLDKWESFVERLVTHYKGRVKYWEIWNEPIYQFTPQFYSELLKQAAVAIRRADPSAKIVGMGGVYSKDWILQVMNFLGANWREHLDIISTHLYPPNTDPLSGESESGAAAFKQDLVDRYGVEVWNTETGVLDEGFYKGDNSNFVPKGDPMWPHSESERYVRGCFYEAERMLINFVMCIGNGLTKYFYYDSRIYANPTYQKSHPTMLEYDDSIRAKGITYAIAAWFLDGSQGLGSVISNATTYAYLFDRNGKATVVLWSKDKLNHSVQLTASDWRAFDMMGNEMAVINSNIPFGRTPVYVQSASLSPSVMRSAFLAAAVSNLADTLPPNLSLDEFPTGPTTAENVGIRWLGIDETSIPSASDPNAVTYSYQLEGRDVGWSAWTAATRISLVSLPVGNYTFRVRARDGAGNISAAESVSITIKSPSPPGVLSPIRNLRTVN